MAQHYDDWNAIGKILKNWKINGLKCLQKKKALRARQQLNMEGCKIHSSLISNAQLQVHFESCP